MSNGQTTVSDSAKKGLGWGCGLMAGIILAPIIGIVGCVACTAGVATVVPSGQTQQEAP